MDSLSFPMYRIISTSNWNNFASSFPNYMILFLACLIVLSASLCIVINESVESGHPCLFPGLKGNTYSLSLFNIILGFDYFEVYHVYT